MSHVHNLLRRGAMKMCGGNQAPAVNLLRKFFHNRAMELDLLNTSAFNATCEADAHTVKTGKLHYLTGNEQILRAKSKQAFIGVMKAPVEFPAESDIAAAALAKDVHCIKIFPRAAAALKGTKGEHESDSDDDFELPVADKDLSNLQIVVAEGGAPGTFNQSVAREVVTLKKKLQRTCRKSVGRRSIKQYYNCEYFGDELKQTSARIASAKTIANEAMKRSNTRNHVQRKVIASKKKTRSARINDAKRQRRNE